MTVCVFRYPNTGSIRLDRKSEGDCLRMTDPVFRGSSLIISRT